VQTKLSSKGQVVLPVAVRDKLRIQAGDTLDIRADDDCVVLIPKRRRKFKTWIEKSPITGMPVIVSERGAPKLTSEWVRQQLEDFP